MGDEMRNQRERRRTPFRRLAAAPIAVCLVFALNAAAALAQEPARPQPDADKLQPGLAAGYYYAMYHDVGEFRPMTQHRAPPVLQLNYPPGGTNYVLTAQSSEGVAADLKGFIKLDRAGTWKFRTMSNDGVRVTIGGKQIINDPGIHTDHVADSDAIDVRQPGWYPLQIMYFQRKGTWALQLYWQPPGAEPEIVPAQAFAHVKD